MAHSSHQEQDLPRLIGDSHALREVVLLADKVARSDCPVLIEGESGTGKELVARRLWAQSHRADCPFIPVNCAGISESLFESQFFGHMRGSFTGAEQDMLGLIRTANGGTLFLDEVGEIPHRMQPKLLRVLQEREVMPVGHPVPVKVDTRFLAGTNHSLTEMVRRGAFRRDLYYRLNIVRIVVPALRERIEDVPVLLDYFSRRFADRYDKPVVKIRQGVRKLLMEYAWPGNVRELITWVERVYATGLEPELLAEMLVVESSAFNDGLPPHSEDGMSLEHVERSAIVRALDQCDFNQRKAARLLKVHRATLARKLKKYDLA